MAISILGGFLVPQLDPLHRGIGFLLWGISNPLWIWYGIRTGKKGIAILFAVYWMQNLTGIWNNLILPIL